MGPQYLGGPGHPVQRPGGVPAQAIAGKTELESFGDVSLLTLGQKASDGKGDK